MPLNFSVTKTIDKDASGAIRKAQRKRMQDAMDKGFAVSQEEAPEDRGTLRQSGYPPEWKNGVLEFGYRAAHAAPMEYGTEPFQPPIEPLLSWSKRVTGDTGLGWYVALHKIPEEGISEQPFVRPGVEATKNWLKNHSFSSYLDKEL